MPANTVVTDTIPAGQEYFEDTDHPFTISFGGDSDNPNTGTGDDSPSVAGDQQSFTYTFSNSFSATYTITYYTRLTGVSSLYSNGDVKFSNSVALHRDSKTDVTAGGTQTFHSQVIAKGAADISGDGSKKYYDYSTHEVTWQITVNRNKLPMTNATVTDSLPAGMEYVVGTFRVDGTAVDDSSLTILGDASSGQTLSYTFPGDADRKIDQEYTVTLVSKLTDAALQSQFTSRNFTNTASLHSDEMGMGNSVTSQMSVAVNNPIITKTAQYADGSDYIDWVVEVNKGKLTLDGGTALTDKLQSGLSLEEDSVQIYPATVSAADGSLVKGSDPLSTDDYTVGYITDSGDPNFNQVTFTFKNQINSAYLIYFTTDITDSASDISNTVTLAGTGVTGTPTSAQQVVSLSSLRAGGGGTAGSVTVTKEDADGNPLAGATFQLLNLDKSVRATKTAGTDGTVTFDTLPFHVFYVVESGAPDGYLRDTGEYRVRLSSTNSSASVTVEDQKALGTVSFQKVSTGGILLGGGKFRLTGTDDAGSPVSMDASSSGGTVSFQNVPVGSNYQIREITAPSGYQRTTAVLTASVQYNGDHSGLVVTVTPSKLENERTHNSGGGGGGGTTPSSEPSSTPAASFPSMPVPGAGISSTPSAPDSSTPVGGTASSTPGAIYIKKADAGGQALSGAEFTLFDANGNVIGKKVTGSSGIIVFSNLAPASYSVQETKAPAKFKRFSDPLNVTLGAGQKLGYTLKDVRESDQGVLGWTENQSLPKTGEFPTDAAVLAAGFLLALAGILLGYRQSGKRRMKHLSRISTK